jgi:hypothetical protein
MQTSDKADHTERDRRADLSDEDFIIEWSEANAPAQFMRVYIPRPWKPSDGLAGQTRAAK